jgi:hypothetical protein
MGERNGNHVMRGTLAGVAGGLVASWVMNIFMEAAGPKITGAIESVQGGKHEQPAQKQGEDQAPKEDATMKTADAVVSTVTGGRHLTFAQEQKAGPIVHYAFGALMGGLYGGLAEYSPAVRTGLGPFSAACSSPGLTWWRYPPCTCRDRRPMPRSAVWRRRSRPTWCMAPLLKECAGWSVWPCSHLTFAAGWAGLPVSVQRKASSSASSWMCWSTLTPAEWPPLVL